ncbi:MAG: class I SAM-dependent methyltransferase [Chitinophagaceae bacterium]
MNTSSLQWNASLYDTKHDFVSKYGEALLDILNAQPGETVLDLGCGTGDLAAQIAASGAVVTGLDFSPEMIAAAQNKFPNIEFQVASASNFQFPGTFDAVFSNATLHWVLDYEGAAKCMYRALRKGGRLVLEMGGKGNVGSIVSALRAELREKGFETNATAQCWYFPSLAGYATVLENAGFRVQFATHFDRPTPLKEEGIVNWLRMFGSAFLIGMQEDDITEVLQQVQEKLRPTNFINGVWIADYKRLRIVAVKE